MSKHVFISSSPAQNTPATVLPDGAITGNGDATAILAGTADRVRLYIGKADFWKADGRVNVPERGGQSPLGLVEILLPHLAYADYRAEQNVDEAYIKLHLQEGKLSADLTVTVCAEDNTVLLELERTYPVLSASVAFLPLEGSGAITALGREGDVRYSIRGFEDPEFRFPCYGICALREVSRSVRNGRERILWAITVCTNHDSAAYKAQAIEKAASLDEADCARMLADHAAWWTNFWSKSGVELPDKELERYWYGSLYAIACCARNKKFPPGLWGAYSTADGMGWFGDYHLNYNYEAPFYPLTVCNHLELMECYSTPLIDFLPQAKHFAKEYLGIPGSYFPVGIGPLGMETDYRPETKEHGHLFLGQKSNGAYAAVIPMMHWYGTRDTEFARREYYPFLLSVAQFWENYLVFEDDAYHIYNDSLNECAWYASPDHMPQGHDDKDPVVSQSLVRMLMKLMIDLSTELGENAEKIPVWQHILDHLPQPDTFERQGEPILRGIAGSTELRELALECMYSVGQIGKTSTPALFEVARNTHRQLSIWDSNNRFCSYYPMAARLGYPAEEIVTHIHEVIEKHGLPNGMFRFEGGGLENSASIPTTVCEMLLQSYEGIIRLFPVWDQDAKFHGLRANGAFVIDGSRENGRISATILSEKGQLLTLEVPRGGCRLTTGSGETVTAAEGTVTVQTSPGERLTVTA